MRAIIDMVKRHSFRVYGRSLQCECFVTGRGRRKVLTYLGPKSFLEANPNPKLLFFNRGSHSGRKLAQEKCHIRCTATTRDLEKVSARFLKINEMK